MESFHIFHAMIAYLWILAIDNDKFTESKELAFFAFELLLKQKKIVLDELNAYRAAHDEHPQLSSTKGLYTSIMTSFILIESRIKRLLDIEIIPTTEVVTSSTFFDSVIREIHALIQNENNKSYITKSKNHETANKLFTLLQVLERENSELSETVASTELLILNFFAGRELNNF